MLFRKRIPRSCAYCARGTALGSDQILCFKKGAVSAYYSCRKFQYDPCKRIPPRIKALDLEQYDKEDFSL